MKKTRISILIDNDTLEALKQYADKNYTRYQTVINHVLRRYIFKQITERDVIDALKKQIKKLERKEKCKS